MPNLAESSKAAPAAAGAPSWQSVQDAELLKILETEGEGLSGAEAEARLSRFGRNDLPAKKPPTLLRIFAEQFLDPLIYVLVAAAVLSFVLKEYTDGGFIVLVLLINAAIGTYQEASATRSAAALQAMLKTMAKVIRGGKEEVLDASLLVPGDLVLLESGDRVPADMRVLSTANLTVDESFLTGENIPPLKQPGVLKAETALGDRTNMCFAGSRVMTGRARALVVSTGLSTEVGRIAKAVAGGDSDKPPLIQRMEKFSKQLTVIMCGLVVILGVVCFLHGMSIQEIFLTAVALAVAAIPEGLPVAITVALSIGMGRMADRHVIVRKLPAVEGLGSCTCIASDKTGTLTVNRQTVKKIVIPGAPAIDVTGEGYGAGELKFADGADQSALLPLVKELTLAGVLCNEASLTKKADGGWDDRGDAMDLALLALGNKLDLSGDKARSDFEPVGAIPYESERKYAAGFNARDGRIQVSVKGALETVMDFCDTMISPAGGTVPLDRALLEKEALTLAEGGYRVLAVAKGTMDSCPGKEPQEKDLPRMTLLGLAGFMDPLRPEAKAAVRRCQEAGIRVVMVTGDHPATAFAIAHDLGIAESPDQVRVGVDLAKVDASSEEFRRLADTGRVFARVAPMQKVEIVEALKAAGNFVAVTGDGVNDAPALKKASCGVAMGSGTDVAKDTAAIVVTDDNFASIEAGVEEGRIAYDNIRKVTFLLVSCGFGELLLFTASILAGLPIPLVAVQLLWLNMATNGVQDVALAFEKGEPGVMNRKPRPPSQGIFDHRMIWQTAVFSTAMAAITFGTWLWLMSPSGGNMNNAEELPQARNLILLLMVLIENVQAFSVRSERISAFKVPLRNNWFLIGGILGAQLLQLACMNIPFTQKVMHMNAISPLQWLKMFGLSLGVLVVMEVFKAVYGRLRGKDEMAES